jgi:hypothetical protein
MYAAFAIGQRWDAAVLLDSDEEGHESRKKITAMNIKEFAESNGKFRVLMLGDAAGIKKTDVAIEDLFPDDCFREWVNRAYGVAIRNEDLAVDGSTLISKRVEKVLKERHGKDLDKRKVLTEMLREFDGWTKLSDLPRGTAIAAEKLFKAINSAFKLV